MFGGLAAIAMAEHQHNLAKRKVFPSAASVKCSYCGNAQQQKDQCWSCGAALPQPPTIRFDTLYGFGTLGADTYRRNLAAIGQSAAARGTLLSGSTMADIHDLTQAHLGSERTEC